MNRKKSEITGKIFSIKSSRDLVEIRNFGRELAGEIGFAGSDRTLISTALSEVCRNVLEYAGCGEVRIETNRRSKPTAIEITVTDDGPGIEDIPSALQEGFSTGEGLGMGLPGAKRIMDDFNIESSREGTTVRMVKWVDGYGI